MTTVVIDTDVASAILKARLPDHLNRLIAGRRLAITFVTVGELTQWTHLHRWGDARRAGLHAFFRSVVILNATVDAAIVWGDIQAAGRLRGRPRPINDSWVAACCIARADHAQHQGLPRLRRARGPRPHPLTARRTLTWNEAPDTGGDERHGE